ncbi:Zinc finger protein Gfi-1b [Folsomia candida]|uniref:Zinc finger protein Gfi-1b n=1 Tax=Folsomia candida TaxID=158441 RepID=A0A226D9Z2_FOLCA|nr:Zinc finger protein Gfi-1b [Folsomia candida]
MAELIAQVSSPPVKSTIVPNPQKQDEPSYITPAEYTPSWTWQDFLTWRTSLLDEGISSPETIPPLTWLVNTYKISAFPCPRCTRFYHTFGTWFRHEAPCEKRCAQPGHKCPDCGFSFTQGRFLETHVRRSHMPLEFLTCTGCGVIFDELKAFNEHVAKESTCLEKAILCKGRGCKRRAYFQTKEAFELHEKTKHCPKDLRPFVCEKCGDKFSSTGILKDHVGKKHMSESGHVTPQRDISSAGARPPRTYSRAVKKAAEKPPDYRLPPCDYCAHGGRSALHYKDAHHDMCVFDVGPDGSEVLRGYRCPRENCDREGRLLVGISAMAYHMKGDCKMKRKKIS